MKISEAYAILEITETTVTETEVLDAYRRRAKETHPDMEGGNEEAFREVQQAYAMLINTLKRPQASPKKDTGEFIKCPKCKGAGRIDQRRAWHTMKVRCPMCKGAGHIKASSV